jgi:hypothetical protein
MRSSIVLPVIALGVFIVPAIGGAQTAQGRDSDPESVPYHSHRDNRFGHEHEYPDRGAIVRELPKGAATVSYAGLAYRFSEGVWFEPRGTGFMVVAPPIGLIVSTLPKFSTVLARHGKTILYGNDTFYLPRPDVGGYEVVNDPDDGESEAAGGGAPSASALSAASPSWDGSSLKAMDLATPALASASTSAAPTAAAPAMTGPVALGTPLALATPVTLAAAIPSTGPGAGSAVAGAGVLAESTVDSSKGNKSLIYPKNGQTPEQQARDRYECYRFGVTQSGFDPMHPPGAGPGANGQADFERAQGVCLDARGYAVR